jgi:integrase
VSIKEAREKRNDARKLLDQGLDPAHQKKIEKSLKALQAEENFKAIALEWLAKNKPNWVKSHYDNIKGRFENHVFDYIGSRPIVEITAPELLAMLNRIVYAGHYETAKRVRSICSQVFRYAIITGRAERDPAGDLVGALPKVKVKNFATITEPKEIGALLRCIEEYQGDLKTRCALKLAPLVFVRPTELRHAEWSEINWDKKEWLILAEKMKMNSDHIVPLSDQAINVLMEIHPLTGKGKYIFPSVRTNSRPMSENTINASLRRMGYTKEEITGHGFRAMASTLLNEQGFNADIVLNIYHSVNK